MLASCQAGELIRAQPAPQTSTPQTAAAPTSIPAPRAAPPTQPTGTPSPLDGFWYGGTEFKCYTKSMGRVRVELRLTIEDEIGTGIIIISKNNEHTQRPFGFVITDGNSLNTTLKFHPKNLKLKFYPEIHVASGKIDACDVTFIRTHEMTDPLQAYDGRWTGTTSAFCRGIGRTYSLTLNLRSGWGSLDLTKSGSTWNVESIPSLRLTEDGILKTFLSSTRSRLRVKLDPQGRPSEGTIGNCAITLERDHS